MAQGHSGSTECIKTKGNDSPQLQPQEDTDNLGNLWVLPSHLSRAVKQASWCPQGLACLCVRDREEKQKEGMLSKEKGMSMERHIWEDHQGPRQKQLQGS